jgi:subtilisin family serine protease
MSTRTTWRWSSLLVVVTMIVGMAAATVSASPAPARPETATAAPAQQPPQPEITRAPRIPPSGLEEVPPEVVELFKNGMTVEQFILLNGGRIPHALESFADREVAVIVELVAPPLAAKLAERGGVGTMSAAAQKGYVETLRQAQAELEPQLKALGARVISRYQKVYNGFLVRVPLRQLAQIRALPGVKAVHRAPEYRPDLAASVPLIGAPQVWEDLGYDGEGVTIAIIDSGIDYYHAALGGSGDPDDYASDDHEVIEPGTFPTAKVIGGYDFAGPNYDASSDDPAINTPVPDPDPIDGDGHGTHVASTAAGIGVTGVLSPGVAPAALLYALKVFGEPAGSTNLVIDAIEWAMDPNGDGDVSDRVDVINMSLGANYGPNDPTDPEIIAVNNASALGVIVVASAGNAGNISYIHGTPAAADTAIAVAASTTGYATGPTLSISGTTYITQTNILYQPPAFDNNTGHFTERVTATLLYVGNITTTDTLCDITGLDPNALSGAVALIQRGGCAFSDKVNNAAALGAVGAIIFNHALGGNERVTMSGVPVAIPAGFIARQDGLNLIPAHGQTVIVSAESEVQTLPDPYTPADRIATFSSRGPRGFDSSLKPDVTAPGVAIFAAKMGSGTGGISYSGTSMAAPHVAGLAALIRQAHPTWTPEQVKAAMMNTAVDLSPAQPLPRQGAGRIQAYPSVVVDTLAIGDPDRVSLNWGVLPIEADTYTSLKNVTLQNFGLATKVYSATWGFGAGSRTLGVSLSLPPTVTVPAMGVAAVPVTLNINATQLSSLMRTLEEYYGYVVFTNTAVPTETLRVPFYLSPRPYTRLTELDSGTTFDYATGYAWFDLYHSGPISSSLWVYPVFAVDGNETGVADAGDVRLVGVDYGGQHATYGDIFVVAINTWGSWHTPQPYFAEFDLYLDVNEDGTPDLVNFNWNYGRFTGAADNDQWVVVQVDLSTNDLYLASPFLIYTDYNAGFMEWYLPATWNGLDDVAPGANTNFDFQLVGFDYWGTSDETEAGRFDIARPPFDWGWFTGYPQNPGPFSRETVYGVGVNDLGGYLYSRPKGVMIVDYNGKPGKGQAYYWPLTVTGYPKVFLPLVVKNYGP